MKKEHLPIVKILKITDNSDGSADIEFEYDMDFKELIKKKLGLKKNPSKKVIREFILKCFKENFYENEDG